MRRLFMVLALPVLAACSAFDGWVAQPRKATQQEQRQAIVAKTPSMPPVAASAAAPASIRASMPRGYLPEGGAPNSLDLLPAPPASGSAAQARDDEAARAAQGMRDSLRWVQAVQDAELGFPAAAEAFSCALDIEISQAATPTLYRLLEQSMVDVGLSAYPTKNRYQRTRPFVVASTPSCTPAEEGFLRNDGSYPSGHSAIGWGWALILAEAAPDRADDVLARGRAFGQSRVICNVHWLSDTEEGRVVAAATVAILHANAEFTSDLSAASREITAARWAGQRPRRDCEKEAAQLAK
jgi:acid phosphatase (class A)